MLGFELILTFLVTSKSEEGLAASDPTRGFQTLGFMFFWVLADGN